ncbi:MAG: GNAT family N-acetyltransferase [Alphaproteobacteria bacterium]
MTEEVTLRPAGLADVAAIDAIYNAARPLEVGDDPEQTRQFRRLPTGTNTMAVLNGQAVGFVTVTREEVRFLYVRPEHHGRGIGRLLLDAALGQIDGLAKLTVFEGNRRAREMYERAGFEVETTVCDVLVMRRRP